MKPQPNQKKGTDLRPEVQQQALAQFVHRYTGDHRPAWTIDKRQDGTDYPLQFANDQDWLAHTLFAVNKDGTLNNREKYCESHPTWPNNPELRKL